MNNLFKFKTIIIFLAAAGFPFKSNAVDSPLNEFYSCRHFFLMEKPPIHPLEARSDSQRVCNEDFALAYSRSTKTPLYTAHLINKAQAFAQRGKERPVGFIVDKTIPLYGRTSINDFVGTGWEAGQLTNLPGGTTNNSALLSNVVPMSPETAQVWRTLSAEIASAAVFNSDTVVEINGVLFEGDTQKIGVSNIWVPSHLYKVIFSYKKKKATAWLIRNKDGHKDPSKAPPSASYQTLRTEIPINFMPALILSKDR